jgi:hypothetical protein
MIAAMEIPFKIKNSDTTGVLVHPEAFSGGTAVILIRAEYRLNDGSAEVLAPGSVLVFVEHDGEPIELIATEATTDSHVELGPENASDFAVALGLE